MFGNLVKNIRRNKGLSQQTISDECITQSSYSKFELEKIEIRITPFLKILDKLEMDISEFQYISNNYTYTKKQQILRDFFQAPYNNKEKLEEISKECVYYLSENKDSTLENILQLCNALKILLDTNDFKKAKKPALQIWEKLSKREQLYITDIYLLNSILFIFPLETCLNIRDFIEKSLSRYNNFHNINKVKMNMHLNIALMFIKENKYTEGIKEINKTIDECKMTRSYIQLVICYVRKGICLNNLGLDGERWISKGINILISLDEREIMDDLLAEVKEYIPNSKINV